MIMSVSSTDRPSVKLQLRDQQNGSPDTVETLLIAYCTVTAAVPQNGEHGLSESIQQDKRK